MSSLYSPLGFLEIGLLFNGLKRKIGVLFGPCMVVGPLFCYLSKSRRGSQGIDLGLGVGGAQVIDLGDPDKS